MKGLGNTNVWKPIYDQHIYTVPKPHRTEGPAGILYKDITGVDAEFMERKDIL